MGLEYLLGTMLDGMDMKYIQIGLTRRDSASMIQPQIEIVEIQDSVILTPEICDRKNAASFTAL